MTLNSEKFSQDAESIATAIMNAVDGYIKHTKAIDDDTSDTHTKAIAKDELKQYATQEIKTAILTAIMPYTIGTGLPNDGKEELPRD